MAKVKNEAFLQDYLATVYGENFPGLSVLWNKQTKGTRTFNNASIPALISAIKADAPRNDLYFGLASQSEELGAGKRGGNDTVVQVSAFFTDVDFATEKTVRKVRTKRGNRFTHHRQVAAQTNADSAQWWRLACDRGTS